MSTPLPRSELHSRMMADALDVARLAREDEQFAVLVQRLAAGTADLLGDQEAGDLLGEHGAGRMVLHRVHELQLGAGAVGHHQAVAGGAVVVGGGEAADVQAAEAAGGDDDGLGLDGEELLGVEAVEHGAGAVALVVEHQFDRRLEFAHGDHVRDGSSPRPSGCA